MATSDSLPPLDDWFVQVEDLTSETANLHSAGFHDQCDSLPKRRSDHLVRRLQVALGDLGLDRNVGDDWVQPTRDGVRFQHLNYREAERLVLRLEALAGNGRS